MDFQLLFVTLLVREGCTHREVDAPLGLMNEFFFDLPAEARSRILARDAGVDATAQACANEVALIAAARKSSGPDLAQSFAAAMEIASLERSFQVVRKVKDITLSTEGVAHVVWFAGFNPKFADEYIAGGAVDEMLALHLGLAYAY